MRLFAWLAAVLVVAVAVGVGAFLLQKPQPVGVAGDWRIEFRDEFDGDGLSTEYWNDHEPWQSEGWAVESAWYPVPHDEEQLEVSDGVAALKAVRADGLPEGKKFTTAHINTRNTFSIPEGVTSFTEARLNVPKGKGLLPAFWLLGDGTDATGEGWPINGEIDILEFANNRDEVDRPYTSVWYPRDVYTDPPGTFLDGIHDTHPDSFEPRPELREGWHTWGLYRSPERMDVYIDGVREFGFKPGETYKQDVPLPPVLFTSAAHLRLSLGVGGEWAGAGWTEDEYEHGELQVDYVRSWQLDD